MTDNPRRQFLDYEIHAARWWVGWVGNAWLQTQVAHYFAWKVNRKFTAYQNSLATQTRLRQIETWTAARQSAEGAGDD